MQRAPGSTKNEQLDAAIDALVSRVEEHTTFPLMQLSLVVLSQWTIGCVPSFAAIQEAIVNAARHAEVASVSVYVEVEDEQLSGLYAIKARAWIYQTSMPTGVVLPNRLWDVCAAWADTHPFAAIIG